MLGKEEYIMRGIKVKKLKRMAKKAATLRDGQFADSFRGVVNELNLFLRFKLCMRIIFKCW